MNPDYDECGLQVMPRLPDRSMCPSNSSTELSLGINNSLVDGSM